MGEAIATAAAAGPEQAGRGNDNTPAKQGLPEGKALELILGKRYSAQLHRHLWQGGIGPALDRKRPVSNNIPVVAAVAAYLLGGPATWLVEYCRRQLAGDGQGICLNGREGGRGQYVGYTATGIRAALAEAERRGDRAAADVFRAWLRAQLVWCALGTVPWPVAPEERLSPDVTVLGDGERCQGHYLGPLTLLVADALRLRVDGKWLRALPDPRKLLSTDPADVKGLQVHAWPWRVWCQSGGNAGVLMGGERDDLVELVQHGDLARVLASRSLGAGELAPDGALGRIRLRSAWQVWRWERAQLTLMESSIGTLSMPCFGWLSCPGLTRWLDPYAHAGIDARNGLHTGTARIVAYEPGGRIRVRAEIPLAGLVDEIELDLRAAGRLQYRLHWEPDGPVQVNPPPPTF